MKYIKSYQDNTEYDVDTTKKYPHVGYLKDTKQVIYVKEKTDYSHDYLTFEALESTKFRYAIGGSTNADMYYSLDGGDTWVGFGSLIDTPTVNAGDTIMFKRTRSGGGYYSKYITFMSSGAFNAMGNPLSIIKGDNFETTALTSNDVYALQNLFSGCTGLISAEKLALPATTLSECCYQGMFSGCTSLTTAPELPATILASSCYVNMFKGCTSLIVAPKLLALSVSTSSYNSMFAGCTSLTTAPELPATTVMGYCYGGMFADCTSLTEAPSILPAMILTEYCYQAMFRNCTSLTVAPELPATTLANQCYGGPYDVNGMFRGCTSLTTAPELPATNTNFYYCYGNMFYGCSSLNYVKMLATTLGSNTFASWLSGVSASGTFVKDASMTTLPTGASGIPTGWTVIDA